MKQVMKACHKCWKEKPISAFNRQKRNPDGYQYWCKECKNTRREEQREDPEYRKREALRDKEVNRRCSAAWQSNNKDKAALKSKRWRDKNPEKSRAISRKSHANNPESHALASSNRRARLLNVPGSFTRTQFREICEQYGNRCLCCGRKIRLEADHVIPITREGTSNDISNIQPLCRTCNGRKQNKIIDYRAPFVALAT